MQNVPVTKRDGAQWIQERGKQTDGLRLRRRERSSVDCDVRLLKDTAKLISRSVFSGVKELIELY